MRATKGAANEDEKIAFLMGVSVQHFSKERSGSINGSELEGITHVSRLSDVRDWTHLLGDDVFVQPSTFDALP